MVIRLASISKLEIKKDRFRHILLYYSFERDKNASL